VLKLSMIVEDEAIKWALVEKQLPVPQKGYDQDEGADEKGL